MIKEGYFYLSDDAIFDSSDINIGSRYAGNDTPLAAGSSYTATANFTIPTTTATGDRYLLVKTDGNNRQGETDETDNVTAVEIEIGAPNLIVENATSPSEAVVGETIEVSWTIENNSDTQAPSNWYDTVFLSNDNILDSSDTRISSQYTYGNTPLAARGNYTVTQNITLPGNAEAGNQFLIFTADKYSYNSNYQGETDETDNTLAVPIELSAPNLVVTDYNAPNFASIGQNLDVSWTVENQGDVTAFGGWSDYVYLSEDAIFDNSDTYLTNQWAGSNTPLVSGDSYNLTANINLPINQQGERYLIFVTDRNSQQTETDETDNFLAVPITIDDNGPNLEVTDVTAPDAVVLGENIDVSWTIANTGGTAATANWYDYIYISDDETFDGSDTLVTSRWTGNDTPLADGDSYTATRNFTVPVTQTGNRYLLFVADRFNRQGEIDETDNVTAVPIQIEAPNSTIVDLSSWKQEGVLSNGNWQVTGEENQFVQQSINGNPTFFVSPFNFINGTVTGTFQVETSSDDDFIGFVFGYQSPISNLDDATNDYEFLLFDWKQHSQTFSQITAPEGFTLSRLTSPVTPDFWGHGLSDGFEVLDSDYSSTNGWNDFQEYEFSLTYTTDRILIEIDDQIIFDVDGTFDPGRFGFYNFSQADVKYGNFSATGLFGDKPIAVDDVYQVDEDDSLTVPIAVGLIANDINLNLGTLSVYESELINTTDNCSITVNSDGSFNYIPNANFAGTDTFTYRTFDGENFSATATVTINVNNVDNDAPTALELSSTSVDELTANDSAIATLTVNDPDPDDTHTYSLIDDAGGRFKIVGDELQVADTTLTLFYHFRERINSG